MNNLFFVDYHSDEMIIIIYEEKTSNFLFNPTKEINWTKPTK
jgi:hypothetical protein